jgi:hypothetical protein
MEQFLSGGIALVTAFSGLFFLRFWRRTRDRFFLYFALSLWIEAAHRATLGLYPEITDTNPFSYMLRIVAYGLIILAILHKNRRGR